MALCGTRCATELISIFKTPKINLWWCPMCGCLIMQMLEKYEGRARVIHEPELAIEKFHGSEPCEGDGIGQPE